MDVYNTPNHFVPEYKTFLFNPVLTAREIAFYPEFNTPEGSDWPPRLKEAFPEADDFSYIYPPPTALLCSPLALFTFDNAASRVWPTISIWFLFVLTFFASRIYRLLKGGDSYGEGLVILACLIFSLRGQTDIVSGNVNPILGGCVACCCYSFLRSRMLAFSCAYIPLILFKAIGLAWLPLLVIDRAYRRALIYLGAFTLILNGIVLAAAGIEPYQKFFSIVRLISIPVGHGLVVTMIKKFGFYPYWLYEILNLFCLELLYFALLKKGNKGWSMSVSRSPLILSAFLAGTLSLFCLFNNVVWGPYGANFLFFPLLGWIMQEGNLATGIWRFAIRGGILFSFIILIGEGFWFSIFGAKRIPFFNYDILFPVDVFVIPAFFLLIAFRRLFIENSNQVLLDANKEHPYP